MVKAVALIVAVAITMGSAGVNFSHSDARSNIAKGNKHHYSKIIKDRGIVPRVQLQKHNTK